MWRFRKVSLRVHAGADFGDQYGGARCMLWIGWARSKRTSGPIFVVLAANPLDDVANTRKIESVWIAENHVPAK